MKRKGNLKTSMKWEQEDSALLFLITTVISA